ncbi:hypothetical protein [Legionella oakridgensis]|uniref:hypothetical protein n=1 Tax=Legionella oakridgensis TaxID=29423 RepID=UPI0003DDF5F4|nr:hypothetical protein [Legionella oakridgensis]ETO94354.1 hypothetical protein LOR_67c18630 [Legionella oakridgensis RV-2-2007]
MEMYRNALRNNRDRLREAGVAGSIPVTPTNKIKGYRRFFGSFPFKGALNQQHNTRPPDTKVWKSAPLIGVEPKLQLIHN